VEYHYHDCKDNRQGVATRQTASKRIARVLVCLHKGELVALLGFVKKTQKTPDDELTLARKRQKELQS